MSDKKLYLVETISMFRMRYVVEAKHEEHATDEVVCELGNSDFKEFSQHHIDEPITSVRELTQEQYLAEFDKDNDYLKTWTEEQKMSFINKIDYDKVEHSVHYYDTDRNK
jgi:hypothetical protein